MIQRTAYPGFWHSVLLCLAFVGLQIVLMIVVGVLDVIFHSHWGSHPALVGIVNMVACALVLAMGRLIGKMPMTEVLALRPVAPITVVAVFVSIGGAVILLSEADNLTRMLLPPPAWLSEILGHLAFSPEHPSASFFLLVIVAPVTEELMFRGLILRGLLRRFSFVGAAMLSSLLFAAVHLNPWQFVSALVLGLIFAWWYARTHSLIPCLIGHAITNAVAFWHQSLPFKIRGFNVAKRFDATALQPLWFDGLGLLLVVAGCWMFWRTTPSAVTSVAPADSGGEQPTASTGSGVPPVIQGRDAAG